MDTRQQLLQVYTEEESIILHEYLKNKNKGGKNNSKGNTFENQFAVYKIANLINTHTEQESVFLSTQVFCFVDDLVIELDHIGDIEFYQIKDVKKLGWKSKKHSILQDFQVQYKITESTNKKTYLFLVVSNINTFDSLVKKLPKEIEGHTKVIHFEGGTSINNLLRINNLFKQEIINLCAINNPPNYVLEAIASIVLGAWDSIDKSKVSLQFIQSKCHTMTNPNYFKGFSDKISDDLKSKLEGIDGFVFSIENGYLVWKYNDIYRGIYPNKIESREFIEFENNIINLKATIIFDDVVPYLTA